MTTIDYGKCDNMERLDALLGVLHRSSYGAAECRFVLAVEYASSVPDGKRIAQLAPTETGNLDNAAESARQIKDGFSTILARCKALEEAMRKIDDETACDKRGPRENLIEIHRLARAALAANQEQA